jgi:hypothetical protein
MQDPGSANHMSRRATGGLLQDGAVGDGRAVWLPSPKKLEEICRDVAR